jgi:hypothetical protein
MERQQHNTQTEARMFIGIECKRTTVNGRTYVRLWPVITGTAKQRNAIVTAAIVIACIVGLAMIDSAQTTAGEPEISLHNGLR